MRQRSSRRNGQIERTREGRDISNADSIVRFENGFGFGLGLRGEDGGCFLAAYVFRSQSDRLSEVTVVTEANSSSLNKRWVDLRLGIPCSLVPSEIV